MIAAESSTTEPIQIIVNGDPGLADWVNIGLTVALVLVTTVYVVLTGRMAAEMKRQRNAAEAARLREKSDRAAYDCLDAVNRLLADYSGRPPGAVSRSMFASASIRLREAAPLVADLPVRDKVLATAEVLFVASFSDEQVTSERLDRALLPVVARVIIQTLANVLRCYLAEREIPDNLWMRDGSDGHGDYYPQCSDAASWMRAVARKESGSN